MGTYRHMLLATDFSESSATAAKVAATLAKRLGAVATLAHVYDSTPFHLGVSAPIGELSERVRDGARRELDKVKEQYFSDVADVHAVVIDAESPPTGIAEHARAGGIDLVIVGTRGRTTLARLLVGSVAEGIVRLSSCDVLTVPPGSDTAELESRVLAPTDFSDAAGVSIRRAYDIAVDLGARLTLLHVFDPSVPVPAPDEAASLFLPTEEIEAQLRKTLTKLHATLGGSAIVDCDLVIASSHAEGIVKYAHDHNSGMVVLGSLGQGALERFLIGSVAERVVRVAHCPVLTVRGKS